MVAGLVPGMAGAADTSPAVPEGRREEMKILALHDGGSGCCWYRVKSPLDQLAQHGHEVTLLSVNDDDRDTITASDLVGYDVLVGQRLNVHKGMDAWRRARGPFSRLVYDADDDVFSVN